MQVERRHGLPRSAVCASAQWLARGDADNSDAVPLRGKGELSSPYAARARTSRGAVSVAKDSGARVEQMILKFERLTQKQQTMLLTLADELLLTVRRWRDSLWDGVLPRVSRSAKVITTASNAFFLYIC